MASFEKMHPIYEKNQNDYEKIIITLINRLKKTKLEKNDKQKMIDNFLETYICNKKPYFTNYLIYDNYFIFNKSYQILFYMHKYFIQSICNKLLPIELEKYILTFVGVTSFNYQQLFELIKLIFT